jgi:DNA polymerase-1
MQQTNYLKLLGELKNEPSDLHLNSRVLIVDGLNQYIRAFATSPVTNEDGLHVGGITGFFLTVGSAIKQIKPTRVILVFDGKGGSQKRREVYSEYKNNRKPGSDIKRSPYLQTDEDVKTSMVRQMRRLSEYLNILPVTTIIIDHIEADDTIAYLTTLVREKNGQSFIMSTDRDFLQLVSDDVIVWSPTKKKLYFKQDVLDEYGISATNFLTYRTIIGDKGDNLPKVKGVGPGTLLKHIPEFGSDEHISVDDLFEICNRNSESKVLNSILKEEQMIRTNHTLMQLKDVNISGINKLKILELFDYPIEPFVKFDFLKMLADDRMSMAIKNIELWISDVFLPLNRYARKKVGL